MRHVLQVFVVLAIIVFTVSMMFPAVERVGEAANRTMTNNNLKQCILAVHHFHDTHRRFPDGFGPAPEKVPPLPLEGKRLSLWFQILPYVEMDNAYRAGDPDSLVASYVAPSDPFRGPNDRGRVNFAGNIRIFAMETLLANNQPVDSPGFAVVVPEGAMISNLTMKQIADGTSNTLMLSTRYANCDGRPTWYATDAHGRSDFGAPQPPGVGGFMGSGSASTPAARDAVETTMFQITPTDVQCVWTPALFGHSFGSGGMSTALADGSVKNISPNITPTTFGRALCPSDGSKLDPDWDED